MPRQQSSTLSFAFASAFVYDCVSFFSSPLFRFAVMRAPKPALSTELAVE